MLNIEEIENTIQELENGNTTFDTCVKLASLYIVRDKLKEPVNQVEISNPSIETRVEAELSDILPQYRKYCNVKKRYQLHEVGKELVQLSMENVCTEIKEFFYTLYAGTDMEEERQYIQKLIEDLQNMLVKV